MRVNISKFDDTTKTCKSCKHYRWSLWSQMWNWLIDQKPKCVRTAPESKVDVISGKVYHSKLEDCQSCSRQRESTYEEDCGREAKFWIPKDKDGLFELIKHTDRLNQPTNKE